MCIFACCCHAFLIGTVTVRPACNIFTVVLGCTAFRYGIHRTEVASLMITYCAFVNGACTIIACSGGSIAGRVAVYAVLSAPIGGIDTFSMKETRIIAAARNSAAGAIETCMVCRTYLTGIAPYAACIVIGGTIHAGIFVIQTIVVLAGLNCT